MIEINSSTLLMFAFGVIFGRIFFQIFDAIFPVQPVKKHGGNVGEVRISQEGKAKIPQSTPEMVKAIKNKYGRDNTRGYHGGDVIFVVKFERRECHGRDKDCRKHKGNGHCRSKNKLGNKPKGEKRP